MEIEQLLRFARTLAGIYDNYEQAQVNPKDFARINIVFRPLPWEIFEGPGFYSEQFYDYAKWNPYRQGIHRLKIKDDTFIVENFDFANKDRLAGSGSNPELLESLEQTSLKSRCGCAMHFTEESDGKYIGLVEPGKKCLVPRNGTLTYLVSEVEVDANNWISRDRGFDPATDQPQWGSEHGPLRFKRIENFSELISTSWIEQKES